MSRHHTKEDMKTVDHPNMEVHTFQSLGDATGYSRHNIAQLYAQGKFTVLCSRIGKLENLLVIEKSQIEVIKALRSAPRKRELSSEHLPMIQSLRLQGYSWTKVAAFMEAAGHPELSWKNYYAVRATKEMKELVSKVTT